jgi:hypothetical protein
MPLVLKDRVQQIATANTTVSFTLGSSVTGFQSFAVIGNDNTTYYSAFDSSGNWEVGIGTYSSIGPTLTRNSIFSSSNSNAAVTFIGNVNVFVTYPSEEAVYGEGTTIVAPSGTILPVVSGGTGVTTSTGTGSVVLSASPTLTGTVLIGSTSGTSTVTLGRSTGTTTVNIATGSTSLISSKTVNIATGGNGTDTINIGRTTAVDGVTTINIGTQIRSSNQTYVNINTDAIGGNAITNIGSDNGGSFTTIDGQLNVSASGDIPITLGSLDSRGPITIGQSTDTQTTNIQAGATTNFDTKTINIGTNGLAGSTTAITVGATAGTSTTTLNGTVNLSGLTASQPVFTDALDNLVSVATTGSGNVVLATSPTLVTPALGTPSSGTLTSCTGLPLTTGITGTLAIANGGTNSTATPTAGGVAYGTGTAYAITSAGTNGQVLTSAGSGVPTWTTPTTGTITGVTGTSPIASSGGTTPNISISQASTSTDGFLSSTDWNTFNSKGSGTVTSVTATSPVTSTGGATPVIAMPAATTSVNGYLTSTDWTTFNSKGSGSVTSVSGTGTVSGISLSGTVTSSGSLTLGGSLDLSSPPAIGNTTPNTGAFTSVTTPSVTATTNDLTLSAISTGAVKFNTLGGLQVQIADATTSGQHTLFQRDNANNTQKIIANGTANLSLNATGGGGIYLRTDASTLTQAFVSHTASAVNYVQVTGSATGSAPIISAQGSDTNINLTLQSKGTGAINLSTGNGTQFRASQTFLTGTAVNYIDASGRQTGLGPILSTNGSDANVRFNITSKGTEAVGLYTNLANQLQLSVTHTASAVNYVQVTGAATSGAPVISAQGSDTNINLSITAKGTGVVNIGAPTRLSFASANYFQASGASAGSSPALSVLGSDTNIDLALTPKGTGRVRFGTYTGTVLTPTGFIEIVDSGGTVRRLLVG